MSDHLYTVTVHMVTEPVEVIYDRWCPCHAAPPTPTTPGTDESEMSVEGARSNISGEPDA